MTPKTATKTIPKKEKEDKAGAGSETNSKAGKKRGWDDIEKLFDDKKVKRQTEIKESKERAKQQKRKGGKPKSARGETTTSAAEFVDDGLGGVYNSEGYTGRVEDGVKVFKAHVLRKPDSGNSEKCPFDCDCCFI